MSTEIRPPIIVKKIKAAGGGGGHGSSAWKIAYADFVTAMMAFFLLMWLVGSTTEGDLAGIAEYFKTPLRVALAGGSGSGDSSSILKGGGTDLTRTNGQVKRGEIRSERRSINLQALRADFERLDLMKLAELNRRIDAAIENSPNLRNYKNQLKRDLMPDGLRIQIVDQQNRPMFDTGSAALKPYTAEILLELAALINEVPNKISLAGHTDSAKYGGGERGYSNWELSADRANASRRELVAGGLAEDKILRVMGMGAAVPLDADDPLNPQNRRISIIVLNTSAQERIFGVLPPARKGEPAPVASAAAQSPVPGMGPGAAPAPGPIALPVSLPARPNLSSIPQ